MAEINFMVLIQQIRAAFEDKSGFAMSFQVTDKVKFLRNFKVL